MSDHDHAGAAGGGRRVNAPEGKGPDELGPCGEAPEGRDAGEGNSTGE